MVDTVRVDVPEPATDVGLKVAVVDDGKPPTLKVTLPVKPPDPVTVTVYVVLAP